MSTQLAALVCALSCVPSVLAGPPVGYYGTVDPTNAATLRATLHPVIEDHTRFPYSSAATDTWNILELADEDPANAGRILAVYRNTSYPKFGGGNASYNREHTWPNSYGFSDNGGDTTNYPYTDCHQLFLSDIDYNSARANHPFRNCHAGCVEYPTDVNNGEGGGSGSYPGNSNWQTGVSTLGTWEVWNARRGDVARAMFYLDIRYEGGNHGVTGFSEPNLILTESQALIDASSTGSNLSVAYMGLLCTLLQWHAQDPVDALEMDRNDVVFSFQGNRNPFTDHPEWVTVLFADQCDNGCIDASDCDDELFCNGSEDCVSDFCEPGSNPCPGQGCDEDNDICTALPAAGPWINELHYDNTGADVGEFFEIAGPAGLDLGGWSVHAYNGNGGSVYDSLILSGAIPDQGGCVGTLAFTFPSLQIQNGSPDGLALVDPANDVVEFLSYEGAFTATNGPANGMMSTDIGVTEPGTTPIGHSLQLAGTGGQASDFTWQPAASNTQGQPNTGQTFDGCTMCEPPDCDDGVDCTVDECVGGECMNTPDAALCDDEDDCTTNACDVEAGCVFPAAEDGLGCDDGDACTQDDQCDNGVCVGVDICCPADLDGDGQVRVSDLIILLAAWGANPGHPADFDGDGQVRVPDLIILLAAWGPCL